MLRKKYTEVKEGPSSYENVKEWKPSQNPLDSWTQDLRAGREHVSTAE